MQALAEEAWRLEPSIAQETPGELAWMTRQHPGREKDWKRQVWVEDDRVVAWGWIKEESRFFFEIHPHRPALVEDVFEWFEDAAAADTRPLTVGVRAGNRRALASLERRGFRHDPEAPWIRWNARRLDEIEEPVAPDGYRLATMAETPDIAARVAVHRAAFDPSRVTEESYAAVMSEWPYRPELDCVAVAPDGSFASFALGWLDAVNATGILEPVGTHPDHQRRGLGRAVCLTALRQLRSAGATTGFVGCRGDDAYPAPRLLYESIGFRAFNRSLQYVKR